MKSRGINRMITVRRIVANEGVERIFPLHSPKVAKIEIVRHGDARRAKLYYLRDRVGKSRRLRDRRRGLKHVKDSGAAQLTSRRSSTDPHLQKCLTSSLQGGRHVLHLLATSLTQTTVDLPRFPSLSPNGDRICFSWRGDLLDGVFFRWTRPTVDRPLGQRDPQCLEPGRGRDCFRIRSRWRSEPVVHGGRRNGCPSTHHAGSSGDAQPLPKNKSGSPPTLNSTCTARSGRT